MITEDYISFETAKLLKEKGFDLAKFHGKWAIDYDNVPHAKDFPEGEIIVAEWKYPLITLQMAMKWLREEHKVFIFLEPCEMNDKSIGAIYKIVTDLGKGFIYSKECYAKQEDAFEDAIKYCLENLI